MILARLNQAMIEPASRRPGGRTHLVGILISPALASDFTPGNGTSAGGYALLIILGVAIALGLANMGLKKWRRRERADPQF